MAKFNELVQIDSSEYWVKVVGMLEQNWAMMDDYGDGVRLWFINDSSMLFDDLVFISASAAEMALRTNGFECHSELKDGPYVPQPPERPFKIDPSPAGRIYSSGKYPALGRLNGEAKPPLSLTSPDLSWP